MKILTITIIGMMVLIIISGFIDMTSEKEGVSISCYDNYNNKIKDITCVESQIKNEKTRIYYHCFFTLGILGFIWIPAVLLLIEKLYIITNNGRKNKLERTK